MEKPENRKTKNWKLKTENRKPRVGTSLNTQGNSKISSKPKFPKKSEQRKKEDESRNKSRLKNRPVDEATKNVDFRILL